jgi:glycosyltransferase involved in cell wall biosynthesis
MEIMKKQIAILLPVYSGDKLEFFKEAIESIFCQTIQSFSVIVLVDGKIGADLEECLNELNKEGRINLIQFPNNRGLSFVLNDGIRFCLENNFEYIARMDADDISIPDRLEKQFSFLEINPNVDVVGGTIIEFDETGKDTVVGYPATHQECLKFFEKRNPLAHASVMFRYTYFKKAGFYSEKHVGAKKWEDTMLWYSGFKNNCVFANIKDPIYRVRTQEAFFNTRRGGYKRAFYFFKDKWKINNKLGFGFSAYLFLAAYCLLVISPVFLKKAAYRFLR